MPPARRNPRRRKRDRNFVAIPYSVGLTLSTLANNAVEAGPLVTFGEDLFVVSVDMTAVTRGLTADEGDFLEVGTSHGDLTDTEVEETLQAELTDPDDIIARERARRPVRRYGFMIRTDADGIHSALEQGKMVRRKHMFSVGNDHSLNVWVGNRSGSQLTTGAVTNVVGTIFGRWQR